ncbi:PREDICTED: secreted phosphoprotein 24 [Condylura cristata]|uniref:secreted phosphoprotein 24 n=1 Tax=Condylura cristata TaxID=143302 RepID=UPI00064395D4|nr:PREDICTED: secreted phosphoprotein 24 [Condylura cristata]
MAVEILILLALGASAPLCAGFPVPTHEPPPLRKALAASVAKVNAQGLSPYLFRVYRSTIKRVSVLDEDSLIVDIEFSVRETACRRDSGEDPATCDFQRGYHVPAARCRSSVQVSAQQVQDVWVRCSWASSSESDSSEERTFGHTSGSSRWKSNYQFGLLPDKSRSERLYERSQEIMRRIWAPGNRRFRNQWHRVRINGDYE